MQVLNFPLEQLLSDRIFLFLYFEEEYVLLLCQYGGGSVLVLLCHWLEGTGRKNLAEEPLRGQIDI